MTATHRMVRLLLAAAFVFASSSPVWAASASEIDREASAALQDLYAKTPSAKALGARAKAILIFPKIVKAGFLVGGQVGNGVLRKNGASVGYYRNMAASYGFQAGGQSFGYVLFLMTNSAVDYLDRSDGWELGTGPSLVVVDKGKAGALTTTTAKDDIYAFIFDQKGLMGGVGIQGSKITRIYPDK
jgi:lipid-binding SYLF domain-containing protein